MQEIAMELNTLVKNVEKVICKLRIIGDIPMIGSLFSVVFI